MPSNYSRLGAAIHLKCPKCREGEMFISSKSYDLKNFSKMHKRCSVCNQPFEPEAGFYYGAMFLSYAIGVVQSLLLFVLFHFAFRLDTLWSFIAVTAIWIAISPYLFRFSRALWLSLFVNYHRDI